MRLGGGGWKHMWYYLLTCCHNHLTGLCEPVSSACDVMSEKCLAPLLEFGNPHVSFFSSKYGPHKTNLTDALVHRITEPSTNTYTRMNKISKLYYEQCWSGNDVPFCSPSRAKGKVGLNEAFNFNNKDL